MAFFFYKGSHLKASNDDIPKSNMLKMRFFGVWTMSNHVFMSIFHSLELIKWIINGRRPNTYKTIPYGRV
jgi:hypothetical protein